MKTPTKTRAPLAVLSASLALAGCAVFDPRDFDGDGSPPAVVRLEAATSDGRILASAFRAPGRRTVCPDGRALLASSIAVSEPIGLILMTLSDDDSGVRRMQIETYGSTPTSVSGGTGAYELRPAAGNRPASAAWTSEYLSERTELELAAAINPSARVTIVLDVADASGKSQSTAPVTFATLEELCR